MGYKIGSQYTKKLVFRILGWCLIALLYAVLGLVMLYLAPQFRELFRSFGLDSSTLFLTDNPWIYSVIAIIMPALQLLFLAGVTWDSLPETVYSGIVRVNIVIFLLLVVVSAFVLYGSTFKLSALI